ncbi:MAG TPA: CHASE3 domain-containing protein, partial [Thermoanaerobaculia bacterium]
MSPSIRRLLWGAFLGLTLLVAAAVALTISVLQAERRMETDLTQTSRPLIDAVRVMDRSLATIVSSARGYILTSQTQFVQQYDDARREFDRAHSTAVSVVTNDRERKILHDFRRHYLEVLRLTDEQMDAPASPLAQENVGKVARLRRSAQDFAGDLTDHHRSNERQRLEEMGGLREFVSMAMLFVGLIIIGAGAIASWRIEQALGQSINRQVRRTEAMIAGMADGVMLVDGDGKTLFINPAGQRLLGRSQVGVGIDRQAEVYRLRDYHGRLLSPTELPA